MRIVLVNWAMIWDGATKGGGVNGYCQSLALEFVSLGHDVTYLSSGVTYAPDPADLSTPGRCRVRRHEDWLGVRTFEVINSPVLAPSAFQFAEPLPEIASPELEARVSELFSLLRPDIVHFHNIEGFSAGCIAAARDSGASVYYSLHNYHTICPQVYLMQGEHRPCRSFRDGHACVGCVKTGAPADEARRRATALVQPAFDPHALAAPAPSPALADPPLLPRLARELKSLVTGESSPPRPAEAAPPAPQSVAPLPGRDLDPASLLAPYPAPGPDDRGQTRFILGDINPPRTFGPADPEWQPLDNDPAPDPPAGLEPTTYAARRLAMTRALSSCDGVLAVSRFVAEKFAALGVDRAKLTTLHIGTRINRVAARHKDCLFEPPPFDQHNPRPVRAVFMGYNNWYKGLPMLADALELMPADELRRLHLFLYAQAGENIEWRFRRLEPRLGGLTMHHGYGYYDIPWMLGGKDLGLVTSVWWDNAPQTVFEFQACGLPILGANLGGIPDFVTDGHNGLLFRGNDRYDLARRLGQIVANPASLFTLRRNVRPPKDISEHARELIDLYARPTAAHT